MKILLVAEMQCCRLLVKLYWLSVIAKLTDKFLPYSCNVHICTNLGCFQHLAIVNCAAMNIGVHRFFWIGVSGFLTFNHSVPETAPRAFYDIFKITPKGKQSRKSTKLINVSKLKGYWVLFRFYSASIEINLSFIHFRYVHIRE